MCLWMIGTRQELFIMSEIERMEDGGPDMDPSDSLMMRVKRRKY
jgi:hypothetical protein